MSTLFLINIIDIIFIIKYILYIVYVSMVNMKIILLSSLFLFIHFDFIIYFYLTFKALLIPVNFFKDQ